MSVRIPSTVRVIPVDISIFQLTKPVLDRVTILNKNIILFLNDIGSFIQYEDGDEVKEEFRGPGGKWIADIAILNAGNVRCIIEVQVTHKTVTPRPEPWYEIDANTFINYMNERESNQDFYGLKNWKKVKHLNILPSFLNLSSSRYLKCNEIHYVWRPISRNISS